jgi:hypothetical protein
MGRYRAPEHGAFHMTTTDPALIFISDASEDAEATWLLQQDLDEVPRRGPVRQFVQFAPGSNMPWRT